MTEELDPKVYPIGKAQNLEFTKEVLYRSISPFWNIEFNYEQTSK